MTSSAKFFTHQRQVVEREAWIEVRDTFTNVTDTNLPTIQENSCRLAGRLDQLWLSRCWMTRSCPHNRATLRTTVHSNQRGAVNSKIASAIFRRRKLYSVKLNPLAILWSPETILSPSGESSLRPVQSPCAADPVEPLKLMRLRNLVISRQSARARSALVDDAGDLTLSRAGLSR